MRSGPLLGLSQQAQLLPITGDPPASAIGKHEAEIEKIKAALPDRPQEQITADDVAAVASQVGQAIAMDETAGAFQGFVKQMLEQAGK